MHDIINQLPPELDEKRNSREKPTCGRCHTGLIHHVGNICAAKKKLIILSSESVKTTCSKCKWCKANNKSSIWCKEAVVNLHIAVEDDAPLVVGPNGMAMNKYYTYINNTKLIIIPTKL